MAILFLGQNYPDECGLDTWLLNLVQIGDNDQTFSLNDEMQGGVLELIAWITGLSGVTLLEEERDAVTWCASARVLVREEIARRAAALKL